MKINLKKSCCLRTWSSMQRKLCKCNYSYIVYLVVARYLGVNILNSTSLKFSSSFLTRISQGGRLSVCSDTSEVR